MTEDAAPSTENKRALGKVAKQGVAWSFLREGVTEVLLFPASMVVSRLLTPTEFGISAAALFFIQLSARLSDLGFNAALVRSKAVTPLHFSSVFVVNLSLGALMFVAMVASAPYIGAFYGTPETAAILPVAAFSFLILPFGAVPSAMLVRDMRFREASIIDWNYCLTFAAFSVGLAWMGLSYWSLVYARLASVAAMTATRIYFARWRPSFRFSWKALQGIVSFGLGMHARRLLEYAAGNLDNVVVGKMMGMNALGIYDKAFSTVSRFLSRMNTGGPGVMFRIFALIQEDRERFRRAYTRVIMSATMLGVPVFAVMIVTAPQLMVVLFGDAWLSAAPPFQVLCLAGVLKLLNAYASSATQALGRVWGEVWRQAATVSLIVAGIVALSPWGPSGAAVAVLAATAVMTVLMHIFLKRLTHLSWTEILSPQIPSLACAAVVATAAWAVEYLFMYSGESPGAWLLLFTQAVVVTLVYLGFVLFVPYRPLRALVDEVARDMAPGFLKDQHWLQRYLQANARYLA